MKTEIPRPAFTLIDKPITIYNNEMTIDNEKILLSEVTGIKYGWASIRLDMYAIGSRYMVELKTPEDKFTLNFRSWFGISKRQQYEKFSALINALWEPVVVRLVNALINNVSSGGTVTIDKCQIAENGITYKNFLIEWHDLSYQKNYNKLTINSKSNPNIWSNLYFTETYNVHIVMSFLDWRFENHRESNGFT